MRRVVGSLVACAVLAVVEKQMEEAEGKADALDEQIVDSDGHRCGRVDDIELTGSPPRITALLVGEGLYPRRLPRPFRRLARRISGHEVWGANALRIPWEEVDELGAAVKLRKKAEELGLGEGDNPDNWIVRRLPWN